MALSQNIQQRLFQKLSPQQIQLMKLLQVPTSELEERIKDEMEENPALEITEDGLDGSEKEELVDEFDSSDEENFDLEGTEDEYNNIDVSEYVSDTDDDIADYRTRDDSYTMDEETKTRPVRVETTFHDLLIEQLSLLDLNEKQLVIAKQVVGSIDDDGYLRREPEAISNDLAFRQNIEASAKEIEEIITKVQLFDPAGICCRNLQECLILQLKRKKPVTPTITLAIKALTKYFDEFTKKHYQKIQQSLKLNDGELKELIQLITKLNPKPGGVAETNKNINEAFVIPDFFIYNNLGRLEVTLNSKNAPELRISEGYRDMLKEYGKSTKTDKGQKEAVFFIKQKMDAAKWFIDAIKQRQQTLLGTMQAILAYQINFFSTGDETTLKPMILKDIAAATNLDISTISRVANSKFVQTEFGTFKLKFFFSESLSTDSGEEVSTKEVKKILKDIVETEDKDKPISDEILTTLLNEKGYNIARRTVAKYREELNIPIARLRRQL
jgi:RNA polymerase sigma-54 factor